MISIPFISLIIDSIISNYIDLSTNFFLPLFTLTSLVVIFPFCNIKKYLKLSIIVGLLYDISLTDTFFINTILFVIIMFFIKFLFSNFNNNLFNTLLILICSILLYRLMYYLILTMSNYYLFNLYTLFKSIYASLILNIIYGFFLYTIMRLIKHKKIKKKVLFSC